MTLLLQMIGANVISLACVGGAIALAVNGRDGWGWFLLVAVLAANTLKIRDAESK